MNFEVVKVQVWILQLWKFRCEFWSCEKAGVNGLLASHSTGECNEHAVAGWIYLRATNFHHYIFLLTVQVNIHFDDDSSGKWTFIYWKYGWIDHYLVKLQVTTPWTLVKLQMNGLFLFTILIKSFLSFFLEGWGVGWKIPFFWGDAGTSPASHPPKNLKSFPIIY